MIKIINDFVNWAKKYILGQFLLRPDSCWSFISKITIQINPHMYKICAGGHPTETLATSFSLGLPHPNPHLSFLDLEW